MKDDDGKHRQPTTPSALARGVDAALERLFGDLDEAVEAERLGLPASELRALRERLIALRDVADKAAAEAGEARG
jgi:hypothetical protein